ncbi:hypothetical protein [Pararhizobium haloflavum]|uniref:hypothetical protein n=1 Tax=Pararhizobium haloflavum TaxID=2037914 RepID=UPI000C17DAA2|nr:hypothetical protein [Pararhizobium haloflavum]
MNNYQRDNRGVTHRGLEDVWTPKAVGEELVEAVRWARAAAGPVGPSTRINSFPDLLITAAERDLEGWPDIDELDAPVRRRAYSPARVSQFERILWWPAQYLREQPGPARVLHVWIRCKITKKAKFDAACDHLGWPRATAYRARDKALSTIAQGLAGNEIARGQH